LNRIIAGFLVFTHIIFFRQSSLFKQLARIQPGLHQNIQDKFHEAGIEIMSPSFSALLDGNETAVPEEYLPKSEFRKGFRILPLGDVYKPRQDPASSLKTPDKDG